MTNGSRKAETLLFIQHPERVADSYELTVRQFLGLIISAENEDLFLESCPEELETVQSTCPERYARVRKMAETFLSRGYAEQGTHHQQECPADASTEPLAQPQTYATLPLPRTPVHDTVVTKSTRAA